MKRPNLHLISVPECDRENESKLENTLQDIIQGNFPNLARQANIQVRFTRKYRDYHKDIPQEGQPISTENAKIQKLAGYVVCACNPSYSRG